MALDTRAVHEDWLLQVTGIPTAAGREQRVVAWVEAWLAERDDLALRRDAAGNLVIRQRRGAAGVRPLFFTAHLDHPAFVVRRVLGPRRVELEFRGGVHDPYFEDAAVDIVDGDDVHRRARLLDLDPLAKPFKRARAETADGTTGLRRGDIGRWRFRGAGNVPVIRDGRVLAPACDDLAAVAAALAALDVARRKRGAGHVGVLLTVAEEVGFVGAIAACRLRTVPKRARLICLENSRSFAESPIGAGPILRVGDRLSVFEPTLTNRIGLVLEDHAKRHPGFRWQRKLMPGGACEATAFAAYGHESTCVCLPLGNYHNMRDIDAVQAGRRPARVGPEFVSVDDYHGMIELLVLCAERLDDTSLPTLRDRMERIFHRHAAVLGPDHARAAKGAKRQSSRRR